MKLDVFLPSLLVSPEWFADAAAPRLAAVETLMARGTPLVSREWPAILLERFSAIGSAAAFSALGDTIDTGNCGWMFAEPAHFRADRDAVNLLARAHLAITADETAQLIDALNTHFADRGLAFFAGASGHWYVCCPPDLLPQTTSIHSARRGALFDKLPQSTGKLSWKAIQNEAQMLLHAHPVNDAREAARKMTINGLWFWAEGVLPANPHGRRSSIGAVFGDTALAAGLAKWIGGHADPLAQLRIAPPTTLAEHTVLVIDNLTNALERADIAAWRDAASALETNIFAPLLDAIRAGTIDEITLTLPRERDSLVFDIQAASLGGLAGWWKGITQKPRPFLESSLA